MRPIRVLLLLLLATAAVRSQEDLLRLLLELPVTAKAEVVSGEFAPWHDAVVRPLQASSRAGRAWAARTTEGPTLEIGLYDPHEFVFDVVASYPHLAASSEEVRVLEARDEVYVRVGEDVLALPLDPSRSGAPSGKSATRP